MNELSTESLKLTIKEGEYLDSDLKKALDRFNDFLEDCQKIQNEVALLEARNKALEIELELERSQKTGESIHQIVSLLEQTNAILDNSKSSKYVKARISQLKKTIRDLEKELAELKHDHLTDLCNLQIEKDGIVEKIRKEADDERNKLKNEGIGLELSAQLRTMEQQLIDQETDFESQVLIFEDKAKKFKDQNQKLAAEISQIKQENAALRQRIRDLEASCSSRCQCQSRDEPLKQNKAKKAKRNTDKRYNALPFDL